MTGFEYKGFKNKGFGDSGFKYLGFGKPEDSGWTDPYCPEYRVLYDQFTNKPSAADAIIQNAKMLAIVAGGRYVKSERHFEFSVHTNAGGEAQLDWIDPTGHLPCTNVNGCAWDAYNGFTGNQVAIKYLKSNFIPSVDGTLISQNNICTIVGIGNDVQENRSDFGTNDGTSILRFESRRTTDQVQYYCNSSSAVNIANANGKKYYVMSRNNGANYDNYINLVKTNSVNASIGLSTREIYICALNFSGNPAASNRQLRFAEILSYLTEPEVLAEIGNENVYLSSYGTNLY